MHIKIRAAGYYLQTYDVKKGDIFPVQILIQHPEHEQLALINIDGGAASHLYRQGKILYRSPDFDESRVERQEIEGGYWVETTGKNRDCDIVGVASNEDALSFLKTGSLL